MAVYSLVSTANDRLLRNFFMAGLFTFKSFYQKSVDRKSPKKYLFILWETSDLGFALEIIFSLLISTHKIVSIEI